MKNETIGGLLLPSITHWTEPNTWISAPTSSSPPPLKKLKYALVDIKRNGLTGIRIRFFGNKLHHDFASRFFCRLGQKAYSKQSARVKCGNSPPRRNRSVIQPMSLCCLTLHNHTCRRTSHDPTCTERGSVGSNLCKLHVVQNKPEIISNTSWFGFTLTEQITFVRST
jgi:hypothetical protein